MGLFGGSDPGSAPASVQAEALERQAKEELQKLEAMRGEVRQRDEDRGLLIEAAKSLKPGQHPRMAAEILFDLCSRPLDLCTCFLALVDYDLDRMSFPFYFEGGKHRNSRPVVFSNHGGLTVRTILDRRPLCYLSQEAQEAHGVVYSDAERITGLIPQSWFGVPLGAGEGWEQRPFGLLSFQSFQRDAFSEARQALLEVLGSILSLVLKADRDRGVIP